MVRGDILILLLILEGKFSQSFIVKYGVSCGFFLKMPFIRFRKFLSKLLSVFYHGGSVFKNLFDPWFP